MNINFTIPCIPPKSTHQSGLRILKRCDGTQFIGKYATSKAKHAQSDLMSLLAPHAPKQPLEGPLGLRVYWLYPYRKADAKKKNQLVMIPCDTRPDVDNILKGLCDVMTRLGFWRDDAQIAEVIFRKYWTEKSGISVTVLRIKREP